MYLEVKSELTERVDSRLHDTGFQSGAVLSSVKPGNTKQARLRLNGFMVQAPGSAETATLCAVVLDHHFVKLFMLFCPLSVFGNQSEKGGLGSTRGIFSIYQTSYSITTSPPPSCVN